MTPYIRWTKPKYPNELMCIECGAVRPTLHLPRLQIDAITRTFLPLVAFATAAHVKQQKNKEQ